MIIVHFSRLFFQKQKKNGDTTSTWSKVLTFDGKCEHVQYWFRQNLNVEIDVTAPDPRELIGRLVSSWMTDSRKRQIGCPSLLDTRERFKCSSHHSPLLGPVISSSTFSPGASSLCSCCCYFCDDTVDPHDQAQIFPQNGIFFLKFFYSRGCNTKDIFLASV